MVECEICGASVSGGSAFTCTYCKGTFCPAHRLPFNHACTRIEDWKSNKPKISKPRESVSSQKILHKNQGLIAGGVILLFLIIIFLWFYKLV